MSYATHESDGAVSTTDPKFDIVIRPRTDRILKLRSQGCFVFHKNCVVKTVEWNRALAGIEAIQASVFVR